MPLKVAACPVCKQPLVFGERKCRNCGQVFQYGAAPPPEPSFSEIAAALRAAGQPVPDYLTFDEAPAPPRPAPASRPAAPPIGQPARAAPPQRRADVPQLEGLDTGRFKSIDVVQTEDIPGFIDSSLFAQFTPKEVDVAPVFGLETGRVEVGEVRAIPSVDVDHTARPDVGEVVTTQVSGIFHSDFLKAPPVPIDAGGLEGLEQSPSTARPRAATADAPAGTKAKKQRELARVV